MGAHQGGVLTYPHQYLPTVNLLLPYLLEETIIQTLNLTWTLDLMETGLPTSSPLLHHQGRDLGPHLSHPEVPDLGPHLSHPEVPGVSLQAVMEDIARLSYK